MVDCFWKEFLKTVYGGKIDFNSGALFCLLFLLKPELEKWKFVSSIMSYVQEKVFTDIDS